MQIPDFEKIQLVETKFNTEELKMCLNFMKEIRKKRNLTQIETANLLKINRSTYNFIENGKQALTVDFFCHFLKIFGYKLEILEAKLENGTKNYNRNTPIKYFSDSISSKNDPSGEVAFLREQLRKKDAIIEQLIQKMDTRRE